MSTNERVAALVERELRKNPALKSADLMVKAAKIDKSVAEMSGRQFHARYTIQARKRLPKAEGAAKRSTRTKSSKGRKRAATGKRRGVLRRRSAAGTAKTDPAGMMEGLFSAKRGELDAAVERAFRRAVKTDSLKQMSALLSAMDAQIGALDNV